jgi:hypothetical protein
MNVIMLVLLLLLLYLFFSDNHANHKFLNGVPYGLSGDRPHHETTLRRKLQLDEIWSLIYRVS